MLALFIVMLNRDICHILETMQIHNDFHPTCKYMLPTGILLVIGYKMEGSTVYKNPAGES